MFYLNNDYDTPLRYDQAKFMPYDVDNFDMIPSYFIAALKSIPYAGQRVIQAEAGKPDLLAFRIYGHTQYWWVILLYNDIYDINDLKIGMTVKYPSLDGLETLYFQLGVAQG